METLIEVLIGAGGLLIGVLGTFAGVGLGIVAGIFGIVVMSFAFVLINIVMPILAIAIVAGVCYYGYRFLRRIFRGALTSQM